MLTIKWNLIEGTGGLEGLGEVGERVSVVRVKWVRMQVSVLVLLATVSSTAVLATQPDTETVSLNALYSFLTDDLVARRFYVQIIAQVNKTRYNL